MHTRLCSFFSKSYAPVSLKAPCLSPSLDDDGSASLRIDRLLPRQRSFVKLSDGRRIAYRELTCQNRAADKTLLVLHGLMSSGCVGLPGASEALLEKYGLKIIAIDRPGYGQSDPHHAQSFRSTCKDILYLMDELDLGEKIWLLGVSMGGAYCWGAARYMPDHIAGIAMVCPAGNLRWRSIPSKDQKAIAEFSPLAEQIVAAFSKTAPFPIMRTCTEVFTSVFLDPTIDVTNRFSLPDRQCLNRPGVAPLVFRDREESLQRNKGFGIAKDLELLNRGWDFDLLDVRLEFKGKKIHIWHGDMDAIVPIRLQECVHRAIPEVVDFHPLKNHGHLSWYCFDPTAPSEILEALFKEHKDEGSQKDA